MTLPNILRASITTPSFHETTTFASCGAQVESVDFAGVRNHSERSVWLRVQVQVWRNGNLANWKSGEMVIFGELEIWQNDKMLRHQYPGFPFTLKKSEYTPVCQIVHS
jgi:hypothetical protein